MTAEEFAAVSARIVAARERYSRAAHAMQSGVAMEMNYRPQPTEPKHLRVGVNTALVDHGALVTLLIAKGVFSEVARYEKHIGDLMGGAVVKLK